MSDFIKLTQNGNIAYVNSEQIGIISAHPSLVNKTNVTLATGLNMEVDGSALEVAKLAGYLDLRPLVEN